MGSWVGPSYQEHEKTCETSGPLRELQAVVPLSHTVGRNELHIPVAQPQGVGFTHDPQPLRETVVPPSMTLLSQHVAFGASLARKEET